MGEEGDPAGASALGAPVCLIRGGTEGLQVADEGLRCVPRRRLYGIKARRELTDASLMVSLGCWSS